MAAGSRLIVPHSRASGAALAARIKSVGANLMSALGH
jgi:hypothetical protein